MLEIDASDLDKEIDKNIDEYVLEVANELINQIKEEVPVHTGRLKQSFQILGTRGKHKYIVGSNVDYAFLIHEGIPHDVDLLPLEKWVRRKLQIGKPESWLVADNLQDKIESEGPEANRYINRAINNLEAKYG